MPNMWTRPHLAKSFWRNLLLIAVPSAALIGLEIYHATAIVPELARSQAAVAHTFRVIDTARALDQSIQDAERGQRGFIITGDAKYLEPYTKGIKEAPARLAELKELTAGDPDQQKRLSSLEQQINVKFAELKQTIDARQDQGFDAARRIVETNLGQDAMREITDLIGFAISAEYKLLSERETRAAEDQRTSTLMSLAAQVLALAVLGVGVVVLMLNLRRITKARQASAESEERFRLLVDGANDYAIYMLDPEGNVVSWNEGAKRIKGYTANEIIGRNFACFFTPEDLQVGLPDQHLRIAAMEGRFEQEGWRVRKDGSRFWANTVLTALRGSDGSLRGFVKITRDVSERRRQEEALEQSQAALAQAQKMEAVGQLTGGIAHDFNNLLTVIQGSLELVERQGAGINTETLARLLRPARIAAERGAALTHRLLAFSRQQALAPHDIDINAHVSSMSELLRRTLGEAVAIETVLAGGLWRCFVDPSQLENALLNLAVNARDAMPVGGKLTLETGNTYLDQEYAAAHDEVTAGQYVMVAVSDTGGGMDAATIARAFEPFFTTKEQGKGTGLGLSQVYGFVKQSGGHVKIYSELGRGTTVKIYLPRYVSEGAPERIFDRSTPVVPGCGEMVLLVEDDADVREFSASALTHLGYRVLRAADAATALSILSEHRDIALLLTDVVLPGLNGRQLADEARRLAPNLKVVYTTGYARNAIVHHGVLDKGVDLLAKPFTTDDLGRKLREVLQRA
jgi:PAS domain S-box-containing protein